MKIYKFYKVKAEDVVKVVEIYGKFQDIPTNISSKIADALNMGERKARESLNMAKELRLLSIAKEFALSDRNKQKLLFRKALQSFRPFLDFVFFLQKGDSPEESVTKVRAIYDIKRNANDILWAFKNWGNFAGVFVNDSFELIDEIKAPEPSIIKELLTDINNELKAKLWLDKVLGDAKNYLTYEDFELLTQAITNLKKDPRNSLKISGEALEDILRSIAKDRNVDVSKKNGIAQIAEEMRKNNILADKHVSILRGLQVFLDRDIFYGLSTFRNMAHHSKDKKEMKKWELSEELALSYLIQVILCIKSLCYYVIEDKLTF